MATPVSEPAPDEPTAESRSPSALYWAAVGIVILGLLATCGALVIIAALHP